MIGEYIYDRVLPKILRELCADRDIAIATFSDDWVIRMEKDGVVHWNVGYTFDLNSASAAAIARDKVAAFEVLRADSVPAIEHYLGRSQTETHVNEARLAHLPANRPYVTKPLQGSGGVGVTFHKNLAAAITHINAAAGPEWALSPYYEITSEQRIILLDEAILLSYTKTQPTQQEGVRFFNLSHGALPEINLPDEQTIELACQAARACTLRLAAIDIAILPDNTRQVMEVNSGISLEHFALAVPNNYALAKEIYKKILDAIFV